MSGGEGGSRNITPGAMFADGNTDSRIRIYITEKTALLAENPMQMSGF